MGNFVIVLDFVCCPILTPFHFFIHRAREVPIETGVDQPLDNPEDVEGRGSRCLQRDDAVSMASTSSEGQNIPTPIGLMRRSLTSIDGIPGVCSQSHSNGGTYRLTQIGILRSFSSPSLTNVSSSSTASRVSMSEASSAGMESGGGEQHNGPVPACFADSGDPIALEQGDPRVSQPTVQSSTRVRRPGSGCSWH